MKKNYQSPELEKIDLELNAPVTIEMGDTSNPFGNEKI